MTHSLGCVSFLNSKPLIDSLVNRPDVHVHFAVPSQLLSLVENDICSTALMSVVDFQTSRVPLMLLPAGMIGSDGPTLTVRVYSRVRPGSIRMLHGDTDSHTSILLAQVILRERYGVHPAVVPLDTGTAQPESLLLIGDKVVTASPDAALYPYQLDLGEEWKKLTGLPFVFAMWMMRKDRALVEGTQVARLLDNARRAGADVTDHLLDRYADEKGWPRELARQYLTKNLCFEVTPAARAGLSRFFDLAQRLELLPANRQIEYFESPR